MVEIMSISVRYNDTYTYNEYMTHTKYERCLYMNLHILYMSICIYSL